LRIIDISTPYKPVEAGYCIPPAMGLWEGIGGGFNVALDGKIVEWIPCILEPDEPSKESWQNWARLIQQIYERHPLTCRKCSRKIKGIGVIEDEDVIKRSSSS
jgi:hypothetical protein